MRDLIDEVLRLQTSWTSANTPDMAARGIVVRHEIPRWLRQRGGELAQAAGVDDLDVEGKDAIGQKSRVPWVRYYSRSRSPHATEGWYVVYLFAADGHAVYLSLNQGATTPVNATFRSKPKDHLLASVGWAREQLGARMSARDDLLHTIELRAEKSPHTRSYEFGNVVAIRYDRGALPDERTLHDDAVTMSGLLGELYRARERSPDPGDFAPEVAEAFEALEDLAGKNRRSTRGGFRASAVERRAIELHGMAVAKKFFRDDRWRVADVSATKSFDLEIKRGSSRHAIEVKATTSLGDQVILTRAEVNEQRSRYPLNGLVVVHSIKLTHGPDGPIASGGVIEYTPAWAIAEERLEPIAYTYKRR